MIYVDNAATTKLSHRSLIAMLPFLEENYGNPSSLHQVGQRSASALQQSREIIAECIGASPKEIYFTSGGSESDTQAILSAAMLGEQQQKKHIVSTVFEHHAVLHTLECLKKRGFEIELLPIGEDGLITAEQVKNAIRPTTCLVTVMFANNEIGTILPISEIGAVCKENGVIFHTDAVQAVGHIPVNVKEQQIDLLSLSAHKFHGPKGIGVLYAKNGFSLTNLIEGGNQERGRRPGTENVPAIVGMATALKEATECLLENEKYVRELRNQLIQGLLAISKCELNGSSQHRLPGNVNVSFEGIDGENLLLLLDQKGICASSGSACTSGAVDASHVLLAIGKSRISARSSIRLTLNELNTKEEVQIIVSEITKAVAYLREQSPLWQKSILS